MDKITVEWTCEQCGTKQNMMLEWGPAVVRGPDPTADDKNRAEVTCRQCRHRQIVRVQ